MLRGYKELRHDPQYTVPLPTDEEFILKELDLDQPGMKEVRCRIADGDVSGARDAYLELLEDTGGARYYFGSRDVPGMMETARTRYGSDEDARLAIEEADRIIKGDIPLFKGVRAVFPGGEYDWNSWLYDSSQYQLHLTRFGYLKFLSRAYCLTGEDKYARCFNGMMDHFLDDNPMPSGDTFRSEHCTWDPLSAGVRLFMLPEAFMTFFSSPSFEPRVKMKLIKSLHQHGRYVRKYHASHGNHVCMQLRGLITAALLLPELREARGWLDYGMMQMPSYIRQNVYPDGVQFEASPNYHLVVMRDLYELVPLFRKLGIDAAEYKHTLEKMFHVLMYLITPNGQLARFGDSDFYAESELKAAMSLGAYLYGRGDFKFFGRDHLPFQLLWRLGAEAVCEYRSLKAEPPAETAARFPIGGYLVARQDWTRDAMYLAMRAGVGVAGHAHSDALSVILFAGREELVMDSGMGLYEWNRERKYAVSTKAHNTVVVDGEDQHVRSLHWNTPPTAACKIWDARHEADYDYFAASHYGYTRYDDPVIHTRKVLFVKNRYWLIVDLFEAEGIHSYEQYFHLPPGEAACDWEKRQVYSGSGENRVLLIYPESAGAEDLLSLEPGLLYTHGHYRTKPVSKRSMTARGKAVYETVIFPHREQTGAPCLDVSRLPVRQNGSDLPPWDATALEIKGEGWKDTVCLFHANLPVRSYLDHTGNPVSEALLPQPGPTGEYEAAGVICGEDVVLELADVNRKLI